MGVCPGCSSEKHCMYECNITGYVPKRSQIIYKKNFSQPQSRKVFAHNDRKKSQALKNIKNVKNDAIKIRFNEKYMKSFQKAIMNCKNEDDSADENSNEDLSNSEEIKMKYFNETWSLNTFRDLISAENKETQKIKRSASLGDFRSTNKSKRNSLYNLQALCNFNQPKADEVIKSDLKIMGDVQNLFDKKFCFSKSFEEKSDEKIDEKKEEKLDEKEEEKNKLLMRTKTSEKVINSPKLNFSIDNEQNMKSSVNFNLEDEKNNISSIDLKPEKHSFSRLFSKISQKESMKRHSNEGIAAEKLKRQTTIERQVLRKNNSRSFEIRNRKNKKEESVVPQEKNPDAKNLTKKRSTHLINVQQLSKIEEIPLSIIENDVNLKMLFDYEFDIFKNFSNYFKEWNISNMKKKKGRSGRYSSFSMRSLRKSRESKFLRNLKNLVKDR